MQRQISTKKKFVADGVFRAEVNELLMNALADFGFSGIEVNFTQTTTEVRVLVSKYKNLLDQHSVHGIKINELKGLIEQRFGFTNRKNHKFVLAAKRTNHRGICAQEQAEDIKKRLLAGVPVRSAAMNVIRKMIKFGAKGCQIIISGKLRQQRAKSMKFKDGYLVHTGFPRKIFLDEAVRHLELKQGIMGIKVQIMIPYNPEAINGKFGVPTPIPDTIIFKEEKNRDEEE